MIRDTLPLAGAPYCGDIGAKCVHDLGNEKHDCCINVIVHCGDAVPFLCLETAYGQGYDDCPYCLGGPIPEKTAGGLFGE